MRKTLNIDEDLLRKARKATNAQTDTETIRLALEALVRAAAYQRIKLYEGSEPDAEDVPRRREEGHLVGDR